MQDITKRDLGDSPTSLWVPVKSIWFSSATYPISWTFLLEDPEKLINTLVACYLARDNPAGLKGWSGTRVIDNFWGSADEPGPGDIGRWPFRRLGKCYLSGIISVATIQLSYILSAALSVTFFICLYFDLIYLSIVSNNFHRYRKPIKLKSPAVNHFCDDNRQTRKTLKKYLKALTTYALYVSLLLQDLRKTAHGEEFQPASYQVVLSHSYLIDSW